MNLHQELGWFIPTEAAKELFKEYDEKYKSKITEKENLSELELDGSQTIAKKGGEEVKYQARKKAKTTNSNHPAARARSSF